MHKLGIIGYGGMGGWHADHALKSDVVELAGIYDIKPERCELAEQKGIHAYDSMEALLSDESIDLVTVAIPNDEHKDVVIKCLLAGKNVICEKPVALSSAEFAEMVDAAHKSGKLFTVHQNRRWDVDFLAMKQLYNSGEIGEVFNVESRIHGSRGIPSDWRGEKKYGGGMLLDWGVHLIDQILQIYAGKKVKKLYCRFEHTTNFEVDDGFKLDLTFDGGEQAYVEVGTYNFIALPRFYMQAKKGTAMITDWREKCKVVKCKAWNESDVLPVQTAAGLTKTMAPRDDVTTDTYEIERPHSDVHDFYRNFCAAIEGKEEQLIKHDEVMRVMKVMEASFKSVEQDAVLACDI
ncbi:MAG TPA: Gfo/Idh/MocA family oxidoreductase [Candidatus Aphodoplasma excrementigallinarum]|uniref:Gfo/Idh/MocA family oxidoreductase n=1 Tax=Candidatus Aphodoplasma excrementigallinarum TaxID=2840673 RepID=A0A9D1NHC1_9FIRM|nr:Gfo/Idh/MocA family oxidoreductase [Candidatus Aphodoplasma excrementigallinarum]